MEKPINAGYAMIEHMLMAGKTFVLGENSAETNPYVTWEEIESNSYQEGHYFTTKEAARADLVHRAISSLSEHEQQVLSLSIVNEDTKRKIIDDYREELFFGDTEACLYDAARYLMLSDTQVENLLNDQQFLSAARRIYNNMDHSYENEALSETLKDLVVEHFTYALPKEFFAVLKISPEEMTILQDALSMPMDALEQKYGAIDPGENILQFIQTIETPLGKATMCINILPQEHKEDINRIEIELYDDKNRMTEKLLTNVQKFEQLFSVTDSQGITWTVDLHADERMRRINQTFLFHSDTDDKGYEPYIGKPCIIDRMLTKDEADILISGPMWKARFEDGTILDVFDHELVLPLKQRWNLIDHPEQIKPIEPLATRILSAEHNVSQDTKNQTLANNEIEK